MIVLIRSFGSIILRFIPTGACQRNRRVRWMSPCACLLLVWQAGCRRHVAPMPTQCAHLDKASLCRQLLQRTTGVSHGSLLVVLLVGIMLGIFFGWRAHGWWSSFAWRPTNTVTQQRDVATQSQVRFAWGRAEPRFVPLADREHGAWLVD